MQLREFPHHGLHFQVEIMKQKILRKCIAESISRLLFCCYKEG